MKSKTLKFASAFLATSLLVTPISSLIFNYDNTAKAENISENEEKSKIISSKDIQEGLIIKDYIILEKKDNIFQFNFYNDESLNTRLKK